MWRGAKLLVQCLHSTGAPARLQRCGMGQLMGGRLAVLSSSRGGIRLEGGGGLFWVLGEEGFFLFFVECH